MEQRKSYCNFQGDFIPYLTCCITETSVPMIVETAVSDTAFGKYRQEQPNDRDMAAD